jgi:uncharacterized repeat protein (TIGR01451 family)
VSYNSIKSALLAVAMILAMGLGMTATPAKAQSTTFAVAKYLCPWTNAPMAPDPGPCLSASNQINQVIPGQPVFYMVTIQGNANPWTLTLAEIYPPGFAGNVQDVRCVLAGSTSSTTPVFTASNPLATSLGPIQIAAGQTLRCTMAGYFTASTATATDASNTVNLTAAGSGGATGAGSAKVTATVLTTATLPTDLSITKTASVTSIPLGGNVTYTLTIRNSASGVPVYLGGFLQVIDQLAVLPGSMALTATLTGTPPVCTASAGAVCFPGAPNPPSSSLTFSQASSNSPSSWPVLARWRYGSGNSGFLPPGGSLTLVYTLRIDGAATCGTTATGHGFKNFATFNLLGQPGVTLSEANLPNNSTDTSDAASRVNITTSVPICTGGDGENPNVTITKTARNPLNLTTWPWGSSVTYDVTVTNNSAVALTGVSLRDYVRPNYGDTAMVATATANPVCVPACVGTVAPPQVVSGNVGYVWTSSLSASLPPQGTITFPITIKYDMNSCAAQAHSNWSVRNTVGMSFATSSGNHYREGFADIPMAPPPLCDFRVTKRFQGGAAPATLLFNTPYQYDVTFTNLAPIPQTIYTLRDSLRIDASGYAVNMPLAYSYSCTGPVTGAGYSPQSPGYPALATGLALHTGNQVNGSQLIAMGGPVTFPAGATLTCAVNVVVQRPAPGDPNCMGTGAAGLQNTAILFPSVGYNVSAGVPPVASMWSSARAPLPRCFNLTVNKAVNPPAALGTGPPLTYTITVTNNGDPIGTPTAPLSAPNWLTLTDVFAGAYTPGAATVTVTNPTGSCNSGVDNCNVIAGSGNPISLGIEHLASGQVIALTFPLAPPFPTENVRNDVAVRTNGTLTTDWYAREPHTLINFQQVPITTPVTPPTGGALLKVCKVAGEGVDVGTPFDFTAFAGGAGARVRVTVPAGPGPGGYCQVVGQYAVGTPVVLAETVRPGHEVSAIAVEGAAATLAPVVDLPGGNVTLRLGPGVSEATFTDVGHGYVEICKAGDVTGMFRFAIGDRRFEVPAGACTPAIELRAGMHRLVEIDSPGTTMLECRIWPVDRESSCHPRDRAMTFEVKAGGIAMQTIVTVVNGPTRAGDREPFSGGTARRR